MADKNITLSSLRTILKFYKKELLADLDLDTSDQAQLNFDVASLGYKEIQISFKNFSESDSELKQLVIYKKLINKTEDFLTIEFLQSDYFSIDSISYGAWIGEDVEWDPEPQYDWNYDGLRLRSLTNWAGPIKIVLCPVIHM